MTSPFKKIIKSVIAISLFVAGLASISACNKGSSMVDYAHNGSVKLKLDYKNHDFFEDGIGQVNVLTYIDGDTTHFTNVYGNTSMTLKARYYGIDTPESTGAVQPFGKKASKFTQSKLEKAAANGTIVVSSPFSTSEDGGPGIYSKPETDSTGSRFLSLVWINETVKNAPVESLVLLNLWIVQEGLSWAKNTSEVPAYQEAFVKAQQQAENMVLGVHSDFDEDFNYGEYVTTSLLEIKHEVMQCLADPEHKNKFDGAKVRVTGVVAGFCDRMLYIQEYYPVDEDDPSLGGEWAGINVFCGQLPISTSYTIRGTYLEVCANASDSDTFGFQLSGTQGHWPASVEWEEGDDNCKILLTKEQNDGVHALQTFEYTKEEMNSLVADLSNKVGKKDEGISFDLYCHTVINEELVCTDAYLNASGTDMTLSFDGCDFDAYIPFSYNGNPEDSGDNWMNYQKVIGKTFRVSGVFSYHQTSSGNIKFQLVVCGLQDLVCLTDSKGTTRDNPLNLSTIFDVEFVDNVYYYFEDRASSASDSIETALADVKQAGETLEEDETSNESFIVSGSVKNISEGWDATYKDISLTIVNGNDELYIFRASVSSSVDGSKIAKNQTIKVVGNVEKHNSKVSMVNATIYQVNENGDSCKSITFTKDDKSVLIASLIVTEAEAKKVAANSMFKIYGLPSTDEEGNVLFSSSVTLISVRAKGETISDPLTPAEAIEVASALEVDGETDDIMYVLGEVKEITSPYDESSTRISFIITADGSDFLVTDARIQTGIEPSLLVVGKTVLFRAKLIKVVIDEQEVLTTKRNGCLVMTIE